jgi:XTP/dITP diphosphohydrolase
MSQTLRFVSSNEFKIREATSILEPSGITVSGIALKIEELQTNDAHRLVKDKALRAFHCVGRPLFVEHTGLYLRSLNDLPGGLTQLFWDSLGADRFAELFGQTSDPAVTARTHVAYCDGRQFHFFVGEASGRIAPEPRGDQDFQWDCVFIPDGFEETYSELGSRKNEISMRVDALRDFATFLAGNRNV